ncbi:hypothetical protein VF21_10170 [Pseudogymnoascus sp. 05NY08]|nr:hypothetical protein VF21_10170 [Pseudogymnoascus sp. 05NY08]
MVGVEGKSMLGEAAEKLGLKAREDRGVGAQTAAAAAAAGAAPKEEGHVPAVTALKNRAGESRSPYVRGHMNNPVAWQLFGDEAIELAKRENKLLFISIGYSACHWCHVMEKESFENDEVAAILNKDFIPIKIDREERPDIDRIYMNFVQATTGSGGWPLNVFVTPTLEPVFGGTYWHGPHSNTPQLELEDHVDFLGILGKLSQAWREQESRCRLDSAQILQQLKDFAAEGTLGGAPKTGAEPAGGLDLDVIDEAYQHLVSTFDTTNSGFGAAPKFPTPSKLAFLLRLPHFPQPVLDVVGAEEVKSAQFMALSTLRAMARGGIHDHIGHGFSRYSVTADWSLPHFEKMLYDNAQLLSLYLDAFLGLPKPDPELLGVVYDLAAYLLSPPIAAPGGGFYSSQDADSFYRKAERVAPNLDDKIVCAWNGIAIGALARAGSSLREVDEVMAGRCLDAAIKAARFVRREMYDESEKTLKRVWRDGPGETAGFADDYAFLVEGLLELYEATFEDEWVRWADELQGTAAPKVETDVSAPAPASAAADGTGVAVPAAAGAEPAITTAAVAGADASRTGVTTAVADDVVDAVTGSSTTASTTTAPITTINAIPATTTTSAAIATPTTRTPPSHPVALDTTPSGGLVEAGETPHPSSKTGTKLPPFPRPRGKGGIETI